MIRPEQIPDEVVEAAARILCHGRHPCWSIVAEVMDTDHDGQATEFRIRARETIAAALASWPDGHFYSQPCFVWNGVEPAIALPVRHIDSAGDRKFRVAERLFGDD